MNTGVVRFVIPLFAMFACQALPGQDCSITPVKAHNIVRSSATDVWTYAQTYATGVGSGYWTPAVTTWETLNGGTLNGRSNIYTTAGAGQIATNQWNDAVTTASGLGSYHTDNTHTLTPDGVSCPGWQQTSSSSSDDLSVLKPTVSGLNAIWYLGGSPDGNYTNTTTLAAASGGAPETPYWNVTANSNKISLSCNSCTFPLVTSLVPSANCMYDITIQMSVGGLNADPFQFNVNEPWYLESGGLSSTGDYFDGWLTVVPYITRDRCYYPLEHISINEHFGPFAKDDPAYTWAVPTAMPLPGYAYGGYTWYDEMSIRGCTGCNPPSQQGNPAGQVGVDQGQQSWGVGSTIEQGGIYVQQNTFRRFSGHGEHQNVVRIQN
jgi:hypothetical protein